MPSPRVEWHAQIAAIAVVGKSCEDAAARFVPQRVPPVRYAPGGLGQPYGEGSSGDTILNS